MKKKFFVTLLIMMVAVSIFVQAKDLRRKVKHDQAAAFMADYYAAYNLYAQDAQTIDLMDDYWAPEFIAVQYLPLPQYPVMDVVAWKNFMVFVHLNITETLVIEEMSIDTVNQVAAVRLGIDFNDRVTGELVLHADAAAFYTLKMDEDKKLKMTTLRLYFADPLAVMALSAPSLDAATFHTLKLDEDKN